MIDDFIRKIMLVLLFMLGAVITIVGTLLPEHSYGIAFVTVGLIFMSLSVIVKHR